MIEQGARTLVLGGVRESGWHPVEFCFDVVRAVDERSAQRNATAIADKHGEVADLEVLAQPLNKARFMFVGIQWGCDVPDVVLTGAHISLSVRRPSACALQTRC